MNGTHKSKWLVMLGLVSVIIIGNLLAGCGAKTDQAKSNDSINQKNKRDQ